MNEKKYLIYLDILGFEDLLKDIGNERGIESRKVRNDFISVIEKGLEEIKQKGRIIEIIPYGGDSWILVTDALDKVFISILEILDHNTGYKDYEKIPLEFGIGTGKFDKWAKFDGRHLTCEDETIKWLKTYIICYYHDWYKQKHNNESPKSTFIILTESAYHELEPLDRKICQKIEYKYKKDDEEEEVITFFAADVDKVQQRGRVLEFLEKIGYLGSKWYGRIDAVYVPPLEYEDMAETLKEKRIVFITGTPEYGKTYTAVRLMWEYYNSGYVPVWIKGGEPAERVEVRRKLETISAELKPGHIVYFEDPFGKTKYEQREGLEREIGTIIDTVNQVEDVYVIITSREEVFKEFEKEKLSAKELGELEKKLNIKKPPYNYEKRKQILLNWAEEENCKWLGNEELKNFVLDYMWYEKILPTPLSIKDFAVATYDIEKEKELREKIKEKSKETVKAFAEEVKNMTDDKILFLSFLSIYDYLSVEFVRETYQELVKELDLKDAWGFDRVLSWFKDKISISDKYIRFSHPSYSEALLFLLVEDGSITRINREIFSKLLLKLAEKRGDTVFFLMAVADNFYELPDDVRNKLLFERLEKDAAAWVVARAVANKSDKLPEDITDLLFKLSEDDEAVWEVAKAVADNFDKFPDDARNKLLLNLSDKDEAVWAVLFAVVYNFDKFPDDTRNKLLLNLSGKDMAVWWSNENAIAYNFDKLPENVRNSLDVLPEPLQQVIGVNVGTIKFIEAIPLIKERLQTICLKANTLFPLYRNFVLKILNKK
ncbi:MAG: hypothetical protein KAV25_05250 [Methanophagales archaeon]|nr:hypothetical protein [Methanophagales archaeon]